MSDNDKIRMNPTFQKMKKDIDGVSLFSNIYKFISIFGYKNEKVEKTISRLSDMKKEFKVLNEIHDTFNSYFSKLGWITYDSLNVELMKKAVRSAKKENIEIAEKILIDYYNNPENIEWLIVHLNGNEEFRPRYDLLREAFEDHKNKRYYACIPIILMMIDGVINDIEQKGFFTESTNLSAWDSITGHSTGLKIISNLFNTTRKKTTTEKITIPYRNGILHGRDLGYANEIVAAKTWATLFAVNDWISDIKKGKKNPQPTSPEKGFWDSLKELGETIKNFDNRTKKNEIIRKNVSQWKPRTIILNEDIPESGPLDSYQNGTPEYTTLLFLNYWERKNYGKMAGMITQFHNTFSIKKLAGQLRRIFENKKYKGFKIKNIIDEAPAISEVVAIIDIELESKVYTKEITFRLIYRNKDNEPTMRGMNNGNWTILENFSKIEHLEFID